MTLKTAAGILEDMKTSKKQRIEYPTLFFPNGVGGYDVSFPHFPGCVTFGRTFEEAEKKGAEVLVLWIEELTSQGIAIPDPDHMPLIGRVATNISTHVRMTRSYATSSAAAR